MFMNFEWTFLIFLIVTVHASPAGLNSGDACGAYNSGMSCRGDLCCSSSGFCGKGFAYCGIGCQKAYGKCDSTGGGGGSASGDTSMPYFPPSNQGGGALTCGELNQGKSCPGNLCCSRANYCGSTPAYCGAGCNPKYGYCFSSSSSTKISSTIASSTSKPSISSTSSSIAPTSPGNSPLPNVPIIVIPPSTGAGAGIAASNNQTVIQTTASVVKVTKTVVATKTVTYSPSV